MVENPITNPRDRDTLAVAATITALYALEAAGANTHRSNIKLPIKADLTGLRLTPLEARYITKTRWDKAQDPARTVAAVASLDPTDKRRSQLRTNNSLLGHRLGTAAFELASVGVDVRGCETAFDAQEKVRDRCIEMIRCAGIIMESTHNTPPSLAQLAEPNSQFLGYIYGHSEGDLAQRHQEAWDQLQRVRQGNPA